MATALFNSIIFGPIQSRRLGVSLGVNLLPATGKVCSFDCVYCECGYNAERKGGKIPTKEEVMTALHQTLLSMHDAHKHLDVITFAGNGEPTMHPDFAEIIDYTLSQRDLFYPEVKVSVLSNSTRIHQKSVFEALKKVDNNILKLDSAIQGTFDLINAPVGKPIAVEELIGYLAAFDGQLIIQTLFLRGEVSGQSIDNTTDEEVNAWLDALDKIKPRSVMIYSIDRPTPAQQLTKVSKEALERIADKARQRGFDVSVA